MKKIFSMILFASILLTLAGCFGMTRMPFNGDITFHGITLTVPEKYIRDSTKSDEDTWIYEYDSYAEYIVIMRKDFSGDEAAALADYAAYMKENKAESEIVSFLDGSAVHTSYTKNNQFCQEILFVHGDSVYAVALRGCPRAAFEEVTKTIALAE